MLEVKHLQLGAFQSDVGEQLQSELTESVFTQVYLLRIHAYFIDQLFRSLAFQPVVGQIDFLVRHFLHARNRHHGVAIAELEISIN